MDVMIIYLYFLRYQYRDVALTRSPRYLPSERDVAICQAIGLISYSPEGKTRQSETYIENTFSCW